MSKLIQTIGAAALSLGLAAPLYAAEPAVAGYQILLDKCKSLGEGSEHAKCITNIKPMLAANNSNAGSQAASPQGGVSTAAGTSSDTSGNAVKDGTSRDEPDFQAAMKECDSAAPGEARERCIDRAKEHYGRM